MPYFGPGFGLGNKYNPTRPLIDGEIVPSKNTQVSSQPEGQIIQPVATIGKKLPVAISVPGNIITEEQSGSESQIIEELFEDLSLFELMELGRSEMVLGQNVSYQPIKNISDIYFTYSPKKILGLSGTFSDTEASSALKIGQYSVDGAIYLDEETGDLVVAVENVKDGFLVQVEIVSGGEIKDS